jgi:hypothetical protein
MTRSTRLSHPRITALTAAIALGAFGVKPVMSHFFYMDERDSAKVRHWIGAVGPASCSKFRGAAAGHAN